MTFRHVVIASRYRQGEHARGSLTQTRHQTWRRRQQHRCCFVWHHFQFIWVAPVFWRSPVTNQSVTVGWILSSKIENSVYDCFDRSSTALISAAFGGSLRRDVSCHKNNNNSSNNWILTISAKSMVICGISTFTSVAIVVTAALPGQWLDRLHVWITVWVFFYYSAPWPDLAEGVLVNV